jgi:hypothetical protein
VLAQPVPADGFALEGAALVPIEAGHTDTDNTSILHVPSIGLVVAGDVVYNGVHQYISEGGNGGLEQWLEALDLVAGLEPSAVVAGHKNRDLPDDPAAIEQTRDYLHTVIRLLADKPTPREFFDEMMRLYPDRLNPSPVWYGGHVLLPG